MNEELKDIILIAKRIQEEKNVELSDIVSMLSYKLSGIESKKELSPSEADSISVVRQLIKGL